MNEEKNISPSLDEFIDKLIAEKSFENIDGETMAQMKEDLMSRIEDRINAAILEAMPEDKLEDFNKILDSGTPENIQKFTQENIPNAEEVIAKALVSFRERYLGM